MLVQWSCIPKSSKCPTRKIERLDGDIGLEPAMDAIAAQVGETRDRVRNVSLTGGWDERCCTRWQWHCRPRCSR